MCDTTFINKVNESLAMTTSNSDKDLTMYIHNTHKLISLQLHTTSCWNSCRRTASPEGFNNPSSLVE